MRKPSRPLGGLDVAPLLLAAPRRVPDIHECGGCRPAADLLLRADALLVGVQVERGIAQKGPNLCSGVRREGPQGDRREPGCREHAMHHGRGPTVREQERKVSGERSRHGRWPQAPKQKAHVKRVPKTEHAAGNSCKPTSQSPAKGDRRWAGRPPPRAEPGAPPRTPSEARPPKPSKPPRQHRSPPTRAAPAESWEATALKPKASARGARRRAADRRAADCNRSPCARARGQPCTALRRERPPPVLNKVRNGAESPGAESRGLPPDSAERDRNRRHDTGQRARTDSSPEPDPPTPSALQATMPPAALCGDRAPCRAGPRPGPSWALPEP